MKIEKLIQEKRWKEISSYFAPKDIAKSLSFLTSVSLAYSLLYNKEWDNSLQKFAIELLETIRSSHQEEWDSSWQYDAFLGLAYDINLNYNERYEAYKRALKKAKTSPPQLLIAIAGCCICPGKSPLSYEQAIEYLQLALKNYLYVDGVGLMRTIYSLKNDHLNEKYWTEMFEKIENHNIESPSLDPQFLTKNIIVK